MMTAGTVLAAVGAVGCWYFVVAYWWSTRGDWHRSAAGRHLMWFTANLGVLFALVVLARLLGDYPGRQTITTTAFALLVAQVYWRIVLLRRAQRREPAGTGGPGRR